MVSRKNVRNNEGNAKVKPSEQGKVAFITGNLGNPYEKNTKNNREWEMGFNRAYFFNLERVKENERKNNMSRSRGKEI